MKYYWHYNYPIGAVYIAENDGCIAGLYFSGDKKQKRQKNLFEKELCGFTLKESPLIKKASKQLDEFFSGKRKKFDLPLKFEGTDFQKQVWDALLTIPYGETRSYGQVAAQIGNPKACRAVGMANNRNPISIICPCHRVIGSDGSLVGYGGGLKNKKFLIDLEASDRDA